MIFILLSCILKAFIKKKTKNKHPIFRGECLFLYSLQFLIIKSLLKPINTLFGGIKTSITNPQSL